MNFKNQVKLIILYRINNLLRVKTYQSIVHFMFTSQKSQSDSLWCWVGTDSLQLPKIYTRITDRISVMSMDPRAAAKEVYWYAKLAVLPTPALVPFNGLVPSVTFVG